MEESLQNIKERKQEVPSPIDYSPSPDQALKFTVDDLVAKALEKTLTLRAQQLIGNGVDSGSNPIKEAFPPQNFVIQAPLAMYIHQFFMEDQELMFLIG